MISCFSEFEIWAATNLRNIKAKSPCFVSKILVDNLCKVDNDLSTLYLLWLVNFAIIASNRSVKNDNMSAPATQGWVV